MPEPRWVVCFVLFCIAPLYVRADDDLAKEFRSLRASIVAQMRDRKVEQRPKAVRKLWDPLESTCRHASLSIL